MSAANIIFLVSIAVVLVLYLWVRIDKRLRKQDRRRSEDPEIAKKYHRRNSKGRRVEDT